MKGKPQNDPIAQFRLSFARSEEQFASVSGVVGIQQTLMIQQALIPSDSLRPVAKVSLVCKSLVARVSGVG
eukprot:scaffold4118_cov127-Cylindrotheca_fusiformis.AAC.1